jgi:suppressor for copper-sensitivity B
MRRAAVFLFGFLCFVLAGGAWAHAASGPWAANDHGRLRLIADDRPGAGGVISGLEVGEDVVLLGLQFRMEPKWKIYWRTPGEAGFPPSADWSGSSNLAAAEMEWPVPHRFSLFGLETFGYEGEVIFPIVARRTDPAQPLVVTAEVKYLTCSDICIPYDETVSLTLPVASEGTDALGGLIDHYREQVPKPIGETDMELLSAQLEGTLESPELVVEVASASPFVSPDLLVEGPPGFSFVQPKVEISSDADKATLRLTVGRSPSAGVLEGKRLVLTITDGPRGAEVERVIRYGDPAALMPVSLDARGGAQDLSVILLLALLGGLILNLMPCVLPVLSLKLLSVIKHGGRETGAIRAGFFATAVGIVFSFLVLASAAAAVKSSGLAVGWGIQFQQPVFLVFMSLLVTLFAVNLFGQFEVPLPAGLATRLAGTGGSGLPGSFATGAFATLLATPCSAPFLGTAVGFALARGVGEIYLVFLFLGLGLAAPYLLVAAWPQLARALPKPGPWMNVLRKVLGVALLATALWLLTIIEAQMGMTGAILVGFILLALWALLWARTRVRDKPYAKLIPLSVVVLALAAILLPSWVSAPAVRSAAPGEGWPRLDPVAIARHVAAGRTVFVDVTADWCITCQVNKKLVLEDADIIERLAAAGMAVQRGDWTSPSQTISEYLAGFGRYGIPFNAVYGPGVPEGLLLPELLTVDMVLEALDKAGLEKAEDESLDQADSTSRSD